MLATKYKIAFQILQHSHNSRDIDTSIMQSKTLLVSSTNFWELPRLQTVVHFWEQKLIDYSFHLQFTLDEDTDHPNSLLNSSRWRRCAGAPGAQPRVSFEIQVLICKTSSLNLFLRHGARMSKAESSFNHNQSGFRFNVSSNRYGFERRSSLRRISWISSTGRPAFFSCSVQRCRVPVQN